MSNQRYKVVAPKSPVGISFDLERQILEPVGAELVEIAASNPEDFIIGARDADAVIARGVRITRTIIEGLDKCQIIAFGGIGVNTIDVTAATEHGIIVTNVPDVFVDEVADHAMMLLLACARKLSLLDRPTRAARWADARQLLAPMPRLTGATLGLIAFGNIPRAVARRAQGFGLHCIAYDPYVSDLAMRERDVVPVTLEEVFSRSDFISCHVPQTPATHHLIGEAHFRLMKPTAYFINTGRGPVVDEAALIKALQEGWLAGAGLDVLEKEPPDPDNPLLKLDNVIVTPHSAAFSDRTSVEPRCRVAREIAAVLSGIWPRHPVNPTVRDIARMQPVRTWSATW